MLVFLDTNVLGILSNPKQLGESLACQTWFERLSARGVYFVSSSLCFYKLKLILILGQKMGKSAQGLDKLDTLRQFIDVLSISDYLQKQKNGKILINF